MKSSVKYSLSLSLAIWFNSRAETRSTGNFPKVSVKQRFLGGLEFFLLLFFFSQALLAFLLHRLVARSLNLANAANGEPNEHSWQVRTTPETVKRSSTVVYQASTTKSIGSLEIQLKWKHERGNSVKARRLMLKKKKKRKERLQRVKLVGLTNAYVWISRHFRWWSSLEHGLIIAILSKV